MGQYCFARRYPSLSVVVVFHL